MTPATQLQREFPVIRIRHNAPFVRQGCANHLPSRLYVCHRRRKFHRTVGLSIAKSLCLRIIETAAVELVAVANISDSSPARIFHDRWVWSVPPCGASAFMQPARTCPWSCKPCSELAALGAVPLGHRPGSSGASHQHLQGGPQNDHHNRPFRTPRTTVRGNRQPHHIRRVAALPRLPEPLLQL